jgi:predicted nucleic-acid-binding protein
LKITADTNVLVRAVVADDPAQSQAAIAALRGAEQIAVALPALCEFVWVLRWRRGWRSWRRGVAAELLR